MARLPRPRLPRGRIRERIRSRRADPTDEPPATPPEAPEATEPTEPAQPTGPTEPSPRRSLRERLPSRPRLPRRRKPRPGGGGSLGERLGSAARSVRYGLGDAIYLLGRGLEAIGRVLVAAGSRLRGLWFRFSLQTRQRIAAALALVAIVAAIWFALLPNLPCQFPAGETCPPDDDAIELVAGDALAYAHANVDPETEQYEAAATLAARLPSLSEQLLVLAPAPAGVPLDFDAEVRPWLAGEVALSIVPGESGVPEQTFLFEVADTAGAEGFAESVASGPLSEGDHAGVTVRTDQRGNASAVVGGFLVLGSEAAVEETIDVAQGKARSLTSSPLAAQVLDALPDHSVAEVAVSADGVKELLAGRRGPLGSLEAFVNFEATVGAGAALVAEDGAIELALHSQLDPERLEASPGFFDAFPDFDPSLTSDLSPDTLAYLGLGDPAASIEDLFTQAIAEAPGVATGFDELIDDLQRTGKLDVQSELLPLLEGEAAVAVEPAPSGGASGGGRRETEAESEAPEVPGEDIGPPDAPGEAATEDLLPPEGAPPAPGVVPPTGVPYVLFVADEVDEVAAQESLAKLQGPLAEALDPGVALQAPVFERREIDGLTASSLRLSATVDLTYAVFDDRLVVASDPRGVAQVAGGAGGLADAQRFQDATEGLPEEPSLLAYLNLADLIALAEREGLAEDPAYALFATDVRRLAALGLGVEQGETTLDTTVRIPLEE